MQRVDKYTKPKRIRADEQWQKFFRRHVRSVQCGCYICHLPSELVNLLYGVCCHLLGPPRHRVTFYTVSFDSGSNFVITDDIRLLRLPSFYWSHSWFTASDDPSSLELSIVWAKFVCSACAATYHRSEAHCCDLRRQGQTVW